MKVRPTQERLQSVSCRAATLESRLCRAYGTRTHQSPEQCVVNVGELDVALSPGDKIAEIHDAAVQTRSRQGCGNIDTDAWLVNQKLAKCEDCGAVLVGVVSDCKQCGAAEEECCVLTYAGCKSCRPERHLKDIGSGRDRRRRS